ncbi:uncharacterized protein AB675_6730 [Cyphellophora attinorum]|uniref:Uncharacterized protein n=1 Tax=Cyphellophora attinorum TaxID=1664694 RepID=A0A0N1HYF3_9EURO|nr:uncharacterized protein AB675_6730 [Phialophora attinorum]KPI43445.1 hypothetical protein AB675_6730 [Phialophora attinorum]
MAGRWMANALTAGLVGVVSGVYIFGPIQEQVDIERKQKKLQAEQALGPGMIEIPASTIGTPADPPTDPQPARTKHG